MVGAYLKKGKGALLLIPKLNFDEPQYLQDVEEKGRVTKRWSKTALKMGHELVATLSNLDDALKAEAPQTPAPAWTGANEYRLSTEDYFSRKIEAVTVAVTKLEEERVALEEALEKAGQLRDLLFEQGDRLETAILQALSLMGFMAKKVNDGDSEFDAVFACSEGRCIGEAEGKDNKDVNITKFSQLERKIAEDFALDTVTEHAKGVLFGNAHRLLPPKDRPGDFTAKCVSAAARTGAALVRTADMFKPAKYLSDHEDKDYARECRVAILQTAGSVVIFPEPPLGDLVVVNSDQLASD